MNSNFDYDWDNVNRRTVLEGVSALERTSDSLARSHQIAIETEEVGTTVRNYYYGLPQKILIHMKLKSHHQYIKKNYIFLCIFAFAK